MEHSHDHGHTHDHSEHSHVDHSESESVAPPVEAPAVVEEGTKGEHDHSHGEEASEGLHGEPLSEVSSLPAESHDHLHSHSGDFWTDTLHILTDPPHIIAELLSNLLFDLVIVAFLWGFVIKRFLIPKLRKDIHREIDAAHGLSEDDHEVASGEKGGGSK